MIDGLAKKTKESDGCELKDAPVETLLKHLKESGIVSVWLQAADGLENWVQKTEAVDELMIGDCEYEVRTRCAIYGVTTDTCNSPLYGEMELRH